MLKTWFEIPLWQRVITALILGVLTGWAWGPEAESIKWIGDFFIKAIKMLVVPLIFFSLVSGVAAIGDLRKLGAVGVAHPGGGDVCELLPARLDAVVLRLQGAQGARRAGGLGRVDALLCGAGGDEDALELGGVVDGLGVAALVEVVGGAR